MAASELSNRADVIDSRDVVERIEELQELLDDADGGIEKADDYDEEREELDALQVLAEEAAQYAPDWLHGEMLIHEDHFSDYAEEFAREVSGVPSDTFDRWPFDCIDWSWAAEQLKQDFVPVDFDGETYLIRGC